MAGGHDDLGAGFFDLIGLEFAVLQTIFVVRHGPSAAARAAAEVVQGIVAHLPVQGGIDTLLGEPAVESAEFIPKSYHGLAHIVAGIMHGDGMGVDRGIQLNSALVDILFQQFLNTNHLEFIERLRKPIFEPGPGCKVCVPSFREQDGFTL